MLKNSLLKVAQSLDLGRPQPALDLLSALPSETANVATRRLVASLWSRALQMRADEEGNLDAKLRRGLVFIDRCSDAIGGGNIWTTNNALKGARENLDERTLAHILVSVLWDLLPKTPYGFQYEVLTRVFAGGDGKQLQAAWQHLLAADRTFVPDYWLFQSLARSWSETGVGNIDLAAHRLLERAGRQDLVTLLEVYVLLLRQRQVGRGLQLAHALEDETQRRRMSDYLLGAPTTASLLPDAVDLHRHLVRDRPADEVAAEVGFMAARVAVTKGDWAAVLETTQAALSYPSLRDEAICLRALAFARRGESAEADNAIAFLRKGGDTPWFLVGRAAMINVTRRHVDEGLPTPDELAAPNLAVGPGRPLAMGLWVGPRLRWIEEMSIRSFLLNGWRYQLYVYDIPENVPDGVEIMDASAVLPRHHLFREGTGSGMHRGSLGAFSDLFRYALLARRGGLYTDTDVINLRPFEPDGMRFISTEMNDAGIVGVNGAMMAAPADDVVQRQAFERALHIAERGGIFFTRIGPQLLAEVLGETGMHGYRLMPPTFLNPIGWMETGRLLASFDETAANPVLGDATNLHVYTETWRLIGLDLGAPPSKDVFLGRLYDMLMNERSVAPRPVRDLVWKAAA